MSLSKRPEKTLFNALHHLRQEYPFFGTMLQQLHIVASKAVPTCGVTYDKKSAGFKLLYNEDFFAKLTQDEQKAVLLHESYHLSHKHLINLHDFPFSELRLRNCAMDLAINQYIAGLPTSALKLSMFKHKTKGETLKPQMPYEYYFQEIDWDEAKKDFASKNGNGEKGENDGLEPLDEHNLIDELGEQPTEEELLKAAKELFQRTIQKENFAHSNIPDSVKDLLDYASKKLSKVNYKRLLSNCLRKSLPSAERQNTYNKPSKRHGYIAPGTKDKDEPKVEIYLDTSGSISVEEFENFLADVDEITRHSSPRISLNMFHTNLYYTGKYKRNDGMKNLQIQSGGTDLREVMTRIASGNADLSVVFTDGYYDDVQISCKKDVVFVISRSGNMQHPLRRFGKTVSME